MWKIIFSDLKTSHLSWIKAALSFFFLLSIKIFLNIALDDSFSTMRLSDQMITPVDIHVLTIVLCMMRRVISFWDIL